MTRIGIGVLTCNRPDYFENWQEQLFKNTNTKPNDHYDDIVVYAHDDTETRKGVAPSMNECLYNLRDCDVIFLFNDDCWPKKEGWIEFFLDAFKKTRQNHFLYCDKKHHEYVSDINLNGVKGELYNSCGGVFMAFTKRVIEKVGYVDTRYKQYGYEHAGYSRRIAIARLNTAPYISLIGTEDYIHACDYSGYENLTKKSSITEEEKHANMAYNDEIYHKELEEWFNVYRPYDPI